MFIAATIGRHIALRDSTRLQRIPVWHLVVEVCAWLATLALVPASFGAATFMGTTVTVLSPTGPDGCRVVVTESSFQETVGTVYVIPHATGIAQRQETYWLADTAAHVVSRGDYTLTWEPASPTVSAGVHEATLTVHGRVGGPDRHRVLHLTCPAD